LGDTPNSDPTSLVVSSRLRRSSRATPCRSVLRQAGLELGATIAAFEATDFDRLDKFFDALSTPIDHVLITSPGPYYAPLAGFDLEAALRDIDAHLLLPLQVARNSVGKVWPGGTLLFMGGTGGRRTAPGLYFMSALSAALPALTKNLALEPRRSV